MIRWGFEKGGAYFATPTIPGEQKRVMVCLGRGDGHTVIFNRLGGDFYSPEVDVIEGREFCQVQTPDGLFNVSAASVADVAMAANVLNAIG